MAEQFPPEVLESEKFRNMIIQAENILDGNSKFEISSIVPSNLDSEQQSEPVSNNGSYEEKERIEETNEAAEMNPSQDAGNVFQESNGSSSSNTEATAAPSQSSENDSRSLNPSRSVREGETQIIEQFEPGVYVTLIVKPNGNKIFKRVRFRYYYSYLFIKQNLYFQFFCGLNIDY
jgi:hypothetical protein